MSYIFMYKLNSYALIYSSYSILFETYTINTKLYIDINTNTNNIINTNIKIEK